MYEHVKKILSSKSPNNVLPHLFSRGKALGIQNVLHLAEISLVLPTNAETEWAFLFLWRTFFKETQSLKNVNLEHILRLRSEHDHSQEFYKPEIELFWPDATKERLDVTHADLVVINTPQKEKSRNMSPINPRQPL